MTTRTEDTAFQLRPTASTLRVGARLVVVAGLCAALLVGFVSGLIGSSDSASGQVAASAARCEAAAC